ncbi:MAG: transglutaminase-like domain-containing protein [Candidatus Woesearchaeota archaeon]|nr:transglutaminase-like domain-containing protein [Candidatus Woesearchaeota archaeon]
MRLLVIFLLCLPAALALTPLEADTMTANVFIGNTVTFQENGPGFVVDTALARLTWFPRDTYLQNIEELSVTPNVIEGDEMMQIMWDRPGKTATFTVESVVTTKNAIVPVREKIPFPLRGVPDEYAPYLRSGDITDQTPAIQRLAQDLVANKDDAYQAVFALADWVTSNVEYNLDSLGEPAIQTASQVLASKWGKCDELTALFISLNRAVGIPARFVAGYSYTNSELFERQWGGHGWAEVWLPSAGWIPFDVTYGEYGYLDAGHVTLKIAADAKETSVDYNARGREFSLQTEPLDIIVTPTEMNAHTDQVIRISLDAPQTKVGFGSAVLILAKVTNKKDYYVSTRLDLSKTTNTDMLSDTYENILLKPKEVRTVPFLVQIDRHLKPGFQYEFPFVLTSRLGEEAEVKINVRESYNVFSAQSFASVMQQYEKIELTGTPFSITCSQGVAYVDTPIEHACILHGARQAHTLDICGSECAEVEVVDNTFTFTTRYDKQGTYTEPFTTKFGGGDIAFFVTSRVVGPTAFTIETAQPDTVRVDETMDVVVSLDAIGALPEDIDVRVTLRHAEALEEVTALPATLEFTLHGASLRPGENMLTVDVTYVDELGTTGSATHEAVIELVDVSFGRKLVFLLEDFGYWMNGLFS